MVVKDNNSNELNGLDRNIRHVICNKKYIIRVCFNNNLSLLYIIYIINGKIATFCINNKSYMKINIYLNLTYM